MVLQPLKDHRAIPPSSEVVIFVIDRAVLHRQASDELELTISGIGTLRNRIGSPALAGP